jgi:hypothetical protein
MKKMKQAFEIGIENTALDSMGFQGAVELSDPSRGFAGLGNRWMNEEHHFFTNCQIKARLSAMARPERVGMR